MGSSTKLFIGLHEEMKKFLGKCEEKDTKRLKLSNWFDALSYFHTPGVPKCHNIKVQCQPVASVTSYQSRIIASGFTDHCSKNVKLLIWKVSWSLKTSVIKPEIIF